MEVVLGLHLDGQRSLKKQNSFDRLVLGPSGFLSQLELYVGLSARRPGKLLRVIHFRKALRRLDNGRRFYSRSLKIDDFGVAAELLEWRDDLYLHGWDGTFRNTPVSRRLADLAEVETCLRGERFAPGNGERLAAVAAALEKFETPVTSVELLEPLERHPPLWRRVLRLLPCRYREPSAGPAAAEGTALHALQHSLLSPLGNDLPGPFGPDASLRAVTADTPLAAAGHVAGELHRRGDVLLMNGGESGVLDEVLEAEGYPRQALQAPGKNLPALQLLPLLLRLRREPLDVDALLAFLTLPEQLSPLDPELSEPLARTLAGSPGTGGSRWRKVLDEYLRREDARAGETVSELHRWIDGRKARYDEPASLEELKSCAELVRDFFKCRKEESEQRALQILHGGGYDQASTFADAIEALLEQGETTLGSHQVDQLLAQASVGTNNLRPREAGSVPDTSHPGAVGEPFDHVIWWWAATPSLDQDSVWLTSERLFLEREGVAVPSPEQVLAWEASDWLRPVLAARGSLLLVLPPEGEERHPLWLKIASILPSLSVEQIESGFERPETERKAAVPKRVLPKKKAVWKLSGGNLSPEGVFSPTSLETFIAAPSRWFLEHVARIVPSRRIEPARGPLLYGNLAHRLTEELVALFREERGTPADFGGWFDSAFDQLVRREGAVLLMPGRSAELENFRFLLRNALQRLSPVLLEQGRNGIHAEHALEGSVNGHRMRGRADLLLFDRDNEPSVIDMKWGRAEDRRRSMQAGLHIQLLAYAAMVHELTGKWPTLAYFIVKTARMLAAPAEARLPAETVRREEDEPSALLWQRLLKSFDWRMQQLRRGVLAVGDAPEGDESIPHPPADGLPPVAPGRRHDPYLHLDGWEETR